MTQHAAYDSTAGELAQLRDCVRSLARIVELPVHVDGSHAVELVSSVLDALTEMLGLGWAATRLHDPNGGRPVDVIRVADSLQHLVDVGEIDQTMDAAIAGAPAIRIRDIDLSIASAPLGIDGDVGTLLAGATRPDFPTPTERLLLIAAANQATVGLQQARLRRRAAEAERDRESRLIMDSIPGMVAVLTATGEIDVLNRQLLEYFGQTKDELKSWATNGTIHSDDVAHVIDVFSRSIASGTPYEIVQRFRRADGVYRWFQNRGVPLRDDTGRVVRWCVLLTDIDEQKRADDERRNAETQLTGEKRLLEMVASGHSLNDVLNALCGFVEDTATNCHCGVYLIDWSGPIFHNAAAPTLPASFNDPIDRLPVRSELGPCARAACLKTQVIVADIESDELWQTSPFRPLALANGLRSCWSTPIYSLSGHVLGTFAIYQRTPGSPSPLQKDLIAQVTHIASIAVERAQSEAALKRSEAFLADGQRLSLTGSFSWRVATNEITWSEQLYRIYEIEIGTRVTPELIRTRVHPEDVSLLERMQMIEQTARGEHAFEWQYRLLMPDASIKYLNAVGHAIRDRDGHVEYVAAVQDVTERRRAEDALARARSELAKVARITSLGVLTASIAHEVNQPLSGIMTNAGTCLRMLDAVPPNVEGARETARRTIRDGNRASDVIARLRSLFSNKELALEPWDLNDATREVIALSANDLQRHHIVLRQELAADLPIVMGDRVQIQQVILNLLRNASDALADVRDRRRRLLIRTEHTAENSVRLTVRDAGVGIQRESLISLFDAFHTTKSGGMGVGLFVSRSIIERHQGRLWAEANEGPGATFSFSIPILQDNVPRLRPA